MIDAEGFRANVGIIICNKQGQLLWTRRYGQTSWQFPQGGVHPGESAEQTMYRELFEEVGLEKDDVRILGSTQHWYKYRLPPKLIRQNSKPLCIGQKQKWFLLELTSDESKIDFNATSHPEFDDFIWVNYWYPVRHVVNFKREVYRLALSELIHSMFKFQLHGQASHQSRRHNSNNHSHGSHKKHGHKQHSHAQQNKKAKRKPRHPYRSHANQDKNQAD
ncbi:RNA pyrophosphohydrolase [Kangiella sp. HZ709]|uniref:RNA pyrophosphohydrolase n=1 Tax=Kangiella sp. HZ709 TaxID=2666328 RepID=UPI0012AF8902|nr:RNA pyrophosphohydrolase [Kangiella sp. HZ709]MRX28085.1 RNA pyrophosphohydrolase [Kangiella sp. HZ709]